MFLDKAACEKIFGGKDELLDFLLRFRFLRPDKTIELFSKVYVDALLQWLEEKDKPLEPVPVFEFSKTEEAAEAIHSVQCHFQAATSSHVIYSIREVSKLMGIRPRSIAKWVEHAWLGANYTQAGEMMIPRSELKNLGEWIYLTQ